MISEEENGINEINFYFHYHNFKYFSGGINLRYGHEPSGIRIL